MFRPARLDAAVGDTIAWVNRDIMPHTATADGTDGWDTGIVAAGATGVAVLTHTGEIPYLCALHPTMQGSIRVLPRGTPIVKGAET